MEQTSVKDLMVPISAYATVRVGTTLLNAMIALENAQEAYTTFLAPDYKLFTPFVK